MLQRTYISLAGLLVAGCSATAQAPAPTGPQAYSQPAYAPQQSGPAVMIGPQTQQGMANGPVSASWVTTGFSPSDFVSYNMTMRARQMAEGYYPATQLFRATMYQGAQEVITVTAVAGHCYRILGVGGQGVQDLDLRLRAMDGSVIDQDTGTDNFPSLGVQRPLCLQFSGNFQIEIVMYSGGGPIGVQAFAR